VLGEYLLLLEGDQTEVQEFVKQAKHSYKNEEGDTIETDLSLQKFIPMPDGISGWFACYNWCVVNWGVNSDIEAQYNKQKRAYSIPVDNDFEDHSPLRAFLAISKQFPQIKFTFEYYDCDLKEMNFAMYGKTEFRNGVVMASEENSRVRVVRCSRCESIKSHEKVG
jgi:hypothetical protein